MVLLTGTKHDLKKFLSARSGLAYFLIAWMVLVRVLLFNQNNFDGFLSILIGSSSQGYCCKEVCTCIHGKCLQKQGIFLTFLVT